MKAAILLAATLSSWVYDQDSIDIPPNVEKLVDHERYAIVKPKTIFSDDDEDESDDCVIVHRGTSTLDDAIHDMDAQVFDECTDDGYVKAFVDSLSEFRADQEADMEKLKRAGTCKKFLMTGHSLGGATVSAFGDHPDVTFKATFGEPKTCCRGSHNDFKHWRVINGFFEGSHDPIPSFPRHKDIHHCSGNTIEFKSGVAPVYSRGDVNGPSRGKVGDLHWHHISNYMESIKGSSGI